MDVGAMRAQRDVMRGQRDRLRLTQQRADVVLVAGPPCSGKTTYVEQHKSPGDLVVDYDALAVALGSPHSHDHPEHLRPYILEARDAVLAKITRDPKIQRAWIIRGQPTAADLAMARQIITMDTPVEVCKKRAATAGRPQGWADLIDQWFADQPDPGG